MRERRSANGMHDRLGRRVGVRVVVITGAGDKLLLLHRCRSARGKEHRSPGRRTHPTPSWVTGPGRSETAGNDWSAPYPGLRVKPVIAAVQAGRRAGGGMHLALACDPGSGGGGGQVHRDLHTGVAFAPPTWWRRLVAGPPGGPPRKAKELVLSSATTCRATEAYRLGLVNPRLCPEPKLDADRAGSGPPVLALDRPRAIAGWPNGSPNRFARASTCATAFPGRGDGPGCSSPTPADSKEGLRQLPGAATLGIQGLVATPPGCRGRRPRARPWSTVDRAEWSVEEVKVVVPAPSYGRGSSTRTVSRQWVVVDSRGGGGRRQRGRRALEDLLDGGAATHSSARRCRPSGRARR